MKAGLDHHIEDCNCLMPVLGLKSGGAGGCEGPDRLGHAVEGPATPVVSTDPVPDKGWHGVIASGRDHHAESRIQQ